MKAALEVMYDVAPTTALLHAGCHLAYRVTGTGPPVLFVQGLGLHGDGWVPQVKGLSARYSCLTFDNRGVAGSQPVGRARLTMELMASDGLALADAQRWDDFHLVGYSMGGLVAVALALSAPDRIRSLTLLCTATRGRDMVPLTPGFLWTGVRTFVGTKRSRGQALMEVLLNRRVRATEDLEAWGRRLESVFGHRLASPATIVTKQAGALLRYDPGARLGRLGDIPTLVTSASEDPLSPPAPGRALAAAIPGSRFHEVPDASHGLPFTHPARTNQLLREHLANAEARRAD